MKTLFIIFVLIWIMPILCFLLVHFRNWRGKAKAKIRWWTVIYFVGIFGILTQWIMFFPAWTTRKWRPKKLWLNPFWFWLDDFRFKDIKKNVYADDYWEYTDGDYSKEKFWTSYKWHLRNRIWNLDSLLRPRKGERKIVETVVDKLTMNGQKVDQSQSWIPMARLKYWKDGVHGDQVNKGDSISKKHSIFGKGYVWESIGKRLTFRYSFLKSFMGLWWNFVAGENDKRYVFSLKIKRKKLIV